jgi:hypothetical protein
MTSLLLSQPPRDLIGLCRDRASRRKTTPPGCSRRRVIDAAQLPTTAQTQPEIPCMSRYFGLVGDKQSGIPGLTDFFSAAMRYRANVPHVL